MLSAANLYTSSLDNIFPRAASIESKYLSYEFYLKKGAIEQYTGKPKGIAHVINFCENEMDNFLKSDDDKAKEICKIIGLIAGEDGDSVH